MAVLDDVLKERVRYHLGYPGVQNVSMISVGIPTARQPAFLVELAMNNLIAATVPRIATIVETLDRIECALVDALCQLKADKVDEITLAGASGDTPLITGRLEEEYRRWANRLADTLGVPLYPFADRFVRPGAGSIPVRAS